MNTAQDDWDDQHRNHEKAPKKHTYRPDYAAMGDCKVCGHVEDSPLHSKPKEADTAEPTSGITAEDRANRAISEAVVKNKGKNVAFYVAEQIRQAEQAARAHERRKTLEEAVNCVPKHMGALARKILALANSSEPGEDT